MKYYELIYRPRTTEIDVDKSLRGELIEAKNIKEAVNKARAFLGRLRGKNGIYYTKVSLKWCGYKEEN